MKQTSIWTAFIPEPEVDGARTRMLVWLWRGKLLNLNQSVGHSLTARNSVDIGVILAKALHCANLGTEFSAVPRTVRGEYSSCPKIVGRLSSNLTQQMEHLWSASTTLQFAHGMYAFQFIWYISWDEILDGEDHSVSRSYHSEVHLRVTVLAVTLLDEYGLRSRKPPQEQRIRCCDWCSCPGMFTAST